MLGLLQLNTGKTHNSAPPSELCIASAAAGEVVAILQRRSVDVVACMAEGDEAMLRSRPNSTRQVQPTMMFCQISHGLVSRPLFVCWPLVSHVPGPRNAKCCFRHVSLLS